MIVPSRTPTTIGRLPTARTVRDMISATHQGQPRPKMRPWRPSTGQSPDPQDNGKKKKTHQPLSTLPPAPLRPHSLSPNRVTLQQTTLHIRAIHDEGNRESVFCFGVERDRKTDLHVEKRGFFGTKQRVRPRGTVPSAFAFASPQHPCVEPQGSAIFLCDCTKIGAETPGERSCTAEQKGANFDVPLKPVVILTHRH